MKLIKAIFEISKTVLFFGLFFSLIAWACYNFASTSNWTEPANTETKPVIVGIKAKMIEIQRITGCKKLDGKAGPEMIRIVNPIVEAENKAEEKELFNSYAEPFFTASGGLEK